VSEILYTSAALRDIQEITDYLQPRSEKRLRRLLAEIDRLARLHLAQPGLGRIRDEYQIGMKSFLATGYLVFYRIRGDVLQVLRVFHGSRDVDTIMTS
jgi:toxin ParE1/3/4